ncbi:MAG: leucine dehydrogenase [Planctomycetes bacterium]|nr:leucine dehydrogenase [Planctomycetota bacterium]
MHITEIPVEGYERVAAVRDERSGLHAIIAVHNTTLGPALGGLRMWPYDSEADALFDVQRLARGMTFKSAIAQTGLGGGKSVIIGSPEQKTEALYLAMGRFIDSFGGRYIVAEDVNTTIADLQVVRRETAHVTGLSKTDGFSGNPSPYTAKGCVLGIEACLERAFGDPSLDGRKIAIQGVGAVGSAMARELVEGGAEVWAADLRPQSVETLADEIGIHPATEEQILTMDCDVFAPCALGGIVNDATISGLRCKVIAGCANNQLLDRRNGEELRARGILYAPDYVINAGGIINIGCELLPGGYDEQVSLEKIRRIPDALCDIFRISDERDISTAEAAFLLAQEILVAGKPAPTVPRESPAS